MMSFSVLFFYEYSFPSDIKKKLEKDILLNYGHYSLLLASSSVLSCVFFLFSVTTEILSRPEDNQQRWLYQDTLDRRAFPEKGHHHRQRWTSSVLENLHSLSVFQALLWLLRLMIHTKSF